MRCPKCTTDGVAHTVSVGMEYRTLLGGRPDYYDQDDRLHHHDPNKRTVEMRCDHGHTFIVESRVPCLSCEYGHEKATVIDTTRARVEA